MCYSPIILEIIYSKGKLTYFLNIINIFLIIFWYKFLLWIFLFFLFILQTNGCIFLLIPANKYDAHQYTELNYDPLFIQWFVGFSDAESNFLISIDRRFIRFRFLISLHKDDVKVLHFIKSQFNCGIVFKENFHYCSFVVQDLDHILNIICPIFISVPFKSNKHLYFLYFYKAVIIKNERGNKINDADFRLIILFKNNMN